MVILKQANGYGYIYSYDSGYEYRYFWQRLLQLILFIKKQKSNTYGVFFTMALDSILGVYSGCALGNFLDLMLVFSVLPSSGQGTETVLSYSVLMNSTAM